MSSPPLHLPTKTSPQFHTLPPLTEKKEGVGGPGSDPLIITEPSPITSHSLVSGRHLHGWPHCLQQHGGTYLSPVIGSANWGWGREGGGGGGGERE